MRWVLGAYVVSKGEGLLKVFLRFPDRVGLVGELEGEPLSEPGVRLVPRDAQGVLEGKVV